MIGSELYSRMENLSDVGKKLFLLKLEQSLKTRMTEDHNSSSKRLVAYVKNKKEFEESSLRSFLAEKLPDHMIPASIITMDEFPTLPNGKIDKKALHNSKKRTTPIPVKSVSELSETEIMLIGIWEEVLNYSPISVEDNFFEIGGDSILSIQVIAKTRKLGAMVSPNELFEYQTITELAKSIDEKANIEEKWEYIAAIRKGGTKKPLFCIHSGGGHVFFYGLLKNYLKADRSIYAVQPSGLYRNEKMHMSVEEMSKDYLSAIREIQPHGPYNILVYCFSTSVGNEMSKILEKVGEEINIIVMDTMASPWNATDDDAMKVRVMSFVKRIFMSPIKTIRMFLEDRIYLFEAIFVKFFGRDDQKELERLKANLRRISVNYSWEEHQGKVSLILTEKPDEKFQEYIIGSWKKYALGGVKIYPTKGNHATLFKEPDIQYVAKKIDECIVD